MELAEKILMLIITGITNFACIPALYVVYIKRMYFVLCVGIFTMITSFMYHSMESIELQHFYITTSNWHKLDNIGAIMCFIMLMVYFMDNLQITEEGEVHSTPFCDADLILNMFGLFLTMLMQANHPWKLENTIVPILLYIGLLLYKVFFIRMPRFNGYYATRGIILMAFAVVCFVKGLDDANDYLRIWHGLWHMSTGISSFFLW